MRVQNNQEANPCYAGYLSYPSFFLGDFMQEFHQEIKRPDLFDFNNLGGRPVANTIQSETNNQPSEYISFDLFPSHSNSSRRHHRDRSNKFFQFTRLDYLLQQFEQWTNPIFVRSQKQNAEVLSRRVDTNIAKSFIRSYQISFFTLNSDPQLWILPTAHSLFNITCRFVTMLLQICTARRGKSSSTFFFRDMNYPANGRKTS